jgi:hypothetical protein
MQVSRRFFKDNKYLICALVSNITKGGIQLPKMWKKHEILWKSAGIMRTEQRNV